MLKGSEVPPDVDVAEKEVSAHCSVLDRVQRSVVRLQFSDKYVINSTNFENDNFDS